VRRLAFGIVLGVVAVPLAAHAQTPDATAADTLRSSIAATVRDSLGYPVVAASILITPGGYIYRTDSAGKFNARNVPIGVLTVALRKPGFRPLESQVNLHAGIDVTLDLVMQRLPQFLAEVEIKAERQCQRYGLEGILCRQEQYAGSHFMNRQDVLEKSKDISFARLLLRDAPGFRQNLNGPATTVESIVGWRCIKWIYDGGFPYSYTPVVRPNEVFAIEIYQPPDIPLEYRQHYWGRRGGAKPCTLVVMWSMKEAQRQLKRMAAEK
jgi:hypothetical protein